MEDDFDVSSEDVGAQSSAFGSYAPRFVQRSPFESPVPQTYRDAAQPNSLFAKDASFYSNVLGDTKRSVVLLNSKAGKSVFDYKERRVLNLGYVDVVDEVGNTVNRNMGKVTYGIVPHGKFRSKDPRTGEPVDIPTWVLAEKAGVRTVPFTGGDTGAEDYRKLLDSASLALETLAQIEQKYKDNPLIQMGISQSEEDVATRSLEATFQAQFINVAFGAKAMGASQSEGELLFMEKMSPQRASKNFGGFKGPETRVLKQARTFILNKVKTVGNNNGVELLPLDAGQQRQEVTSSHEASSARIQ